MNTEKPSCALIVPTECVWPTRRVVTGGIQSKSWDTEWDRLLSGFSSHFSQRKFRVFFFIFWSVARVSRMVVCSRNVASLIKFEYFLRFQFHYFWYGKIIESCFQADHIPRPDHHNRYFVTNESKLIFIKKNYQYGLSDRILDNFSEDSSTFLVREKYPEFRQISHISRTNDRYFDTI